MKYFIIALVIIVLVIIFVLYLIRRNRAIRRVKCDSEQKKLSIVNDALNPFGFSFLKEQDIVVSNNDAWQRDMGYCDFYDLNAPSINIVMDSEPIYFEYQDKEYRIEFWKGQYGISTGAEVGIYIHDFDSDLKEGYYRCARDDERLEICFQLQKKCFLFSREGLSWWLTGFDVGKFSNPKDLKLSVCVRFPCKEMQIAFVEGLLKAGYTENKIRINCDCVCFNLCCPKNYKLNHCHKFKKCLKQIQNRINCAFFMRFTRYFNRTLDKLVYLSYLAPCLYNIIIRLCIPRRKQKKNIKVKKHHNN